MNSREYRDIVINIHLNSCESSYYLFVVLGCSVVGLLALFFLCVAASLRESVFIPTARADRAMAFKDPTNSSCQLTSTRVTVRGSLVKSRLVLAERSES
jgi:hypothetical protein